MKKRQGVPAGQAENADTLNHGATRPPAPVSLRGVALTPWRAAQVIAYLIAQSERGNGGYVLTPNLDVLRLVAVSEDLAAVVAGANLRLADGMPLIWASRIQGTPLPERVAGSSLLAPLSAAAAEMGRSVFLLGGAPGVLDSAAAKLQSANPGLKVAGKYCPPVGFADDPLATRAVFARVAESAPDFIYIGLPFAMAARLARDLSREFPNAWCIGVGVSLSFLAGDLKRAPHWMQRSGLEWLHRLIQEPRRLFERYVVYDMPFFFVLMLSAALQRKQRE